MEEAVDDGMVYSHRTGAASRPCGAGRLVGTKDTHDPIAADVVDTNEEDVGVQSIDKNDSGFTSNARIKTQSRRTL